MNYSQSVLASRLAGKGVRLTRQRRILLELIERAPRHLHASDILRLAKEQDEGIDRATVYRTLSLLKSHGLIEELDLLHLDGSEHHYEVTENIGHVHIGCTRCGKITEIQSDLVARLGEEIGRTTGAEVGSIRVEASAICSDCLRER